MRGNIGAVQPTRWIMGPRRTLVSDRSEWLFSEGIHSYWSMRSGLDSRLSLLHDVKTCDLVCVVALVLGISVGVVLLTTALKSRPDVDASRIVWVAGLSGSYRGTVLSVAGAPVSAFLGVPYADPRTQRFAAPIPWYHERQRYDNTAPAPGCAQATPNLDGMNASTSENCLSLNIWSPLCASYPCKGNRTVVVFFHGGFFQTGSNNNPHYDGRVLAALGDVVVVVPNWRLGVLGFLSLTHSDEAPVNAGLLDQAEALRWTVRNVEFFGGNKSDLVVVGHGSGASSLAYHLVSASSQHSAFTIRRAVFMSESPLTRYPVHTDHEMEEGAILRTDILAQLFCNQASQNYSSLLECLRNIPVEALFEKPPGALRELPAFFPVLPIMWSPSTWKKLTIPRKTSVLLGFSDEEGLALLLFFYRSLTLHEQRGLLEAVLPALRLLGFPSSEAEAILDHYRRQRPQYGTDSDLAEHLLSDLLAVCPVRFFAEQLRAWGNTVHGYVLHRADYGSRSSRAPWDYAVRLLFGSPLLLGAAPAEQALSRHVISRWVHFFKSGEVKAEEYSTSEGEFAVSMMPLSDRTSTWVPDMRRDACERLRPFFQAFMSGA